MTHLEDRISRALTSSRTTPSPDLFERVLYNGVLAGVSLAGNTFFYQNPLESNGRARRTEYFEVACCPANLARMLEQLPELVYAQTDDTVGTGVHFH